MATAIIALITLLIFGVPVYLKDRRQQKQLEQLKKNCELFEENMNEIIKTINEIIEDETDDISEG